VAQYIAPMCETGDLAWFFRLGAPAASTDAWVGFGGKINRLPIFCSEQTARHGPIAALFGYLAAAQIRSRIRMVQAKNGIKSS
jgi:hypothetical protein